MNTVASRTQARRLFPRLWAFVACVGALVGLCSRLGLWQAYAGVDRSTMLLWPALWQGLRYDLVAGASAAWLLVLLAAPLRLGGRRTAAVRMSQGLGLGLLCAFALAAACEHFYYAFYKSRFDPIVFGLFEDTPERCCRRCGTTIRCSAAPSWRCPRSRRWPG